MEDPGLKLSLYNYISPYEDSTILQYYILLSAVRIRVLLQNRVDCTHKSWDGVGLSFVTKL